MLPLAENYHLLNNIVISQDAFRKPKWIFDTLALLFGLMYTSSGNYYFAPLILIGVVVFLLGSGLEIDPNQMRYREYKSLAWKRRGTWKSLSAYAAIIILVKLGTKTRPGPNLAIQHSLKTEEYQIYFTDKNHRLRLYITDFPEGDKAQQYAAEIANKTGLPVERFNPVVSTSSRNRR